ncbi:hypothetical protein MOMOMM108M1_00060 [Morganella morganii]
MNKKKLSSNICYNPRCDEEDELDKEMNDAMERKNS